MARMVVLVELDSVAAAPDSDDRGGLAASEGGSNPGAVATDPRLTSEPGAATDGAGGILTD
jgi:hypothetical protein